MSLLDVSPGLSQVLGRALIDGDFRDRLLRDREAALDEWDLSDTDREALLALDPDAIAEHAGRLGPGALVNHIQPEPPQPPPPPPPPPPPSPK